MDIKELSDMALYSQKSLQIHLLGSFFIYITYICIYDSYVVFVIVN